MKSFEKGTFWKTVKFNGSCETQHYKLYSYSVYMVLMYVHTCVGAVIEGPRNITYLPGVTPLPIELTCNITTGVAIWSVNGVFLHSVVLLMEHYQDIVVQEQTYWLIVQ